MGVYIKCHSQTGVETRDITVVEPGLGARMGKRSLCDGLRVKFTLCGHHENVKQGAHTWFPATKLNEMKSPTSATILSGYNRENKNKANREDSDTNCEGITAFPDVDKVGDGVVDKGERCKDRGEGHSSEESKGRGEFHFCKLRGR